MGSPSDEDHCKKIAKHCKELGLICQLRVTSAHKGTEETLKILAQYEGMWLILYVGLSVKGKLYSKSKDHAMKAQRECKSVHLL
jgi:phosphoribosylcarboxyaminoimidazole (NCAIR) mutase